MSSRYTIVIPVLNQWRYTAMCLDSLQAQGVRPADILVIDNASTDETPARLAERAAKDGLGALTNRVNLGCGGAWTQGALLARESDWVVLLNNDVLAGPRAIDAMLDAAEAQGLKVVSPALLEGAEDYGFAAFAPEYLLKMAGTARRGWFHGVCFAVHRSVFEAIGFPDTDRRLGGHEDMEYLVRCLRAGIAVGTVGDAVFHHFGSITQKAMKKESGAKSLGDRHYFYSRLGMGWLARKRFKLERERQRRQWSIAENARCGHSLHMLRTEGQWRSV
ncbi:Glycosyl transferase, family 2 [Sphaerotilus natans subsp. natans DSM 6575]|uniref:Glycosyl transferase, family 2 n=1 Tax=Sphaerotilus natans subsp. natans DSM 6575 TaxID=1286631 RepID=A0A059KQR7_9BURK|nr:glycosyltransferase family 2 protein [Sphaerotilus natans]KDB53448.1 Glycosyl transferase, family 2 [Sphaerotilus natans subsp. natans DSM 6575]SIR28105.1 Glycosyltransferase, GT2 family [Sphaerotilus natans]